MTPGPGEDRLQARVVAVYGELTELSPHGSAERVPAFQGRSAGTAVVGDAVEAEAVPGADPEAAWRITAIAPRERCLWRSSRRRKAQLVAARIDRLAVVSAVEPPPREGLVDRYILAAEAQGIEPVLILNKTDLEGSEEARERLRLYEDLGYPVHAVSAKEGQGMEEAADVLARGWILLVGHSGVGKSTLLNRLLPGTDLETSRLARTGKGRHTTTTATAHRFREGYLVDTPGIREFGLVDVGPGEVGVGFREIRELAAECRFNDCAHRTEPGCAVREAVEKGEIDGGRYASYLRIRESLEAGER
ncbi:MAG: ribosome small subunit-dependent GTPase A [bacterium]